MGQKLLTSTIRYFLIQILILILLDAIISAMFWDMDAVSDRAAWEFSTWTQRLAVLDYLKSGLIYAGLFGIALALTQSKKIHEPRLGGTLFIAVLSVVFIYSLAVLRLAPKDNVLLIPISHYLSWALYFGQQRLMKEFG